MKTVLVTDDSAFMRKALKRMIESDEVFRVVGAATDGIETLDRIEEFNPDVLTLDVEMPKRNGLDTLKEIRKVRPFLPVLMVSSITRAGSDIAIRCLEEGAFDIVCKPESYVSMNINEISGDLIQKLRAAVRLPIMEPKSNLLLSEKMTPAFDWPAVNSLKPRHISGNQRVIAIGTSTGGPVALQKLLPQFPKDFPAGFLVVQHMPPGSFIYSLAERLNSLCEIEVKIAEEGEEIQNGLVLIAPIGRHMIVNQRGATFYVTFREDRHNGFHCPSVDELFHSVGEIFGKNGTACILTGMGSDGIRGVPYVYNGGGHVIAESEESCVVYGMPRSAVEAGYVHTVTPLSGLAAILKRQLLVSPLNSPQ